MALWFGAFVLSRCALPRKPPARQTFACRNSDHAAACEFSVRSADPITSDLHRALTICPLLLCADRQGQVVRDVAALPLAEDIPIAFNSCRKGPRNVEWRDDKPADMCWIECQVRHRQQPVMATNQYLHDWGKMGHALRRAGAHQENEVSISW